MEKKGIHYFVGEVFPRILTKIENVQYIVVGDGPWRPRIENLIEQNCISDRVLLVGELPMDSVKLKALYHRANLLVMPNVHVEGDAEGFGIVALEAGAAGRWVVASRVDGLEDAVIDGQNGTLVEPGDAEGFCETVVQLLADSLRWRELGRQARDFVVQNYNWTHIASLYHQVFTKVIALHSTVI